MFSTLALLGYIFNFSVYYSNWAIEALNSCIVFMKRVDEAITAPYEESILHETPVIYQEKGLDFENVYVSW